jgi:hypothetical protein
MQHPLPGRIPYPWFGEPGSERFALTEGSQVSTIEWEPSRQCTHWVVNIDPLRTVALYELPGNEVLGISSGGTGAFPPF